MLRAERLLHLIEILRRHRRPVSGQTLAEETGVSLRTLYRDIASLQAMGAPLEGEPGLGYVLGEGFMLPPLMFREEEIEALVLGAGWVAERGDGGLSSAAENLLAKIAKVLPDDLRQSLETSGMLVGPVANPVPEVLDLALVRNAIRQERKLEIAYCNVAGEPTQRVIWPFALGYFEKVRLIVAWCELRNGIRHFRTDRVSAVVETGERYPKRRAALMRLWQEQEETKAH